MALPQFHIVGGHPALDLVNTVAPRVPAGPHEDYLDSPEAVVEWARRAGVISPSEAPVPSPESLADVLALRALTEAALAGRELDAVVARWSAAIARATLTPTAGGTFALVVGTAPATMIGDRLADALVDLLRNADLSRLHSCPLEQGGCGWLFLDRSRNQSRKWCTMDDCGTHAKSRRLTERRREKAAARPKR
ncbi:CGNR zinc finger domain-containing protein [Actinoplanes sp. CA-030573]|uniref:CGNR zinc finger domain-containing protein n=1 Tax=Actinoplanes sp. CA-030573 TaxID=3239898 RepID=UPI003D8E1021